MLANGSKAEPTPNRKHEHTIIKEGHFGKKNKTTSEVTRCFLLGML